MKQACQPTSVIQHVSQLLHNWASNENITKLLDTISNSKYTQDFPRPSALSQSGSIVHRCMVLYSSLTQQDTKSITALSRKGAEATTKVNLSWFLISYPLLPRSQQQEREQLNKKALYLSVANKECSTLPSGAEIREAYTNPSRRRSCHAKEKKENGFFSSNIKKTHHNKP